MNRNSFPKHSNGARRKHDASRLKHFIWIGFRLIIAGATLSVLVVHLSRQPLPSIPDKWQEWLGVISTVVLLLPIVLIRAFKWQAIIKIDQPEVSFRESLRSYLGAMPFGLITPGRVGELMRVAYLPSFKGGALRGAGLVAVDRLVDLVALLWPAVVGLWILLGPWAGLFSLAVAFGGLGLGYWLRVWSIVMLKLPPSWRMRGLAIPTDGFILRRVVWFVFLGVLVHIAVALQYALVMRSLAGGSIPWLTVMGVMSVITLINALPISIAGLGIREGCATLFLAKYGVPAAAAGVGAFLVFLINQAILCPIGLLLSPERRIAR